MSSKFHFFSQLKIYFSQLLIHFWYLRKWNISFIILSLKCGQPCVNSPSYFQQWNLNLEITFSNSSIDSKLGLWNLGLRLAVFPSFSQFRKRSQTGIFKCCSGFTSPSFLIREKDWKLWFFNISLDCTSKYFPIHLTVGKLGFL